MGESFERPGVRFKSRNMSQRHTCSAAEINLLDASAFRDAIRSNHVPSLNCCMLVIVTVL